MKETGPGIEWTAVKNDKQKTALIAKVSQLLHRLIKIARDKESRRIVIASRAGNNPNIADDLFIGYDFGQNFGLKEALHYEEILDEPGRCHGSRQSFAFNYLTEEDYPQMIEKYKVDCFMINRLIAKLEFDL